jgi:hypothetical protein
MTSSHWSVLNKTRLKKGRKESVEDPKLTDKGGILIIEDFLDGNEIGLKRGKTDIICRLNGTHGIC